MSLMVQFKKIYLFAFLIILIAILFANCWKVANYLSHTMKKDRYDLFSAVEHLYNILVIYPKVLILSLGGVVDSIAIFTLISTLTRY